MTTTEAFLWSISWFIFGPMAGAMLAQFMVRYVITEPIRKFAYRFGWGARYVLECVQCMYGWPALYITLFHEPIFLRWLLVARWEVWGVDVMWVPDKALSFLILWLLGVFWYKHTYPFVAAHAPKRRVARVEPLLKKKELPVEEYDLLIVGGGVVGCAIAYVAAAFSNFGRICLIESNKNFAMVNSSPDSNAETLHNGSTESNMTLAYALVMKRAARRMATFLERFAPHAFKKMHKILIGVGKKEIEKVEKRFAELSPHYAGLKLLRGSEIAEFEPMVVKGRKNPDEIVALLDPDGHAVDYQMTAHAFAERANEESRASGKTLTFYLGTRVRKITKEGEWYRILTKQKVFRARVAIVAAGPYSLIFAHMLGLGKKYVMMPISGVFWLASGWARGKIYAFQPEGIPVARAHADAAVYNLGVTRLGPTAMLLPLMIKNLWRTFFHFLQTGILSGRAIWAILKIMSSRKFLRFEIMNALSYLPFSIGKRVFLHTAARHIFPSMRSDDLHFSKGSGGIRPQLLNLETGKLEMGLGKIAGECILCVVTPSPGASKSLDSAVEDVRWAVEQLGGSHAFYEELFKKEFGETEPFEPITIARAA